MEEGAEGAGRRERSDRVRGRVCACVSVCSSQERSSGLSQRATLGRSVMKTSTAMPSRTDGTPSMMNSHCQPFSPQASICMSEVASGAPMIPLNGIASISAAITLAR